MRKYEIRPITTDRPNLVFSSFKFQSTNVGLTNTRMWANAQRDGRPAEYRWRPMFNAAKFG